MGTRRLLVVDLDRTIFDCDRFYLDTCKVLQSEGRLDSRQLTEITALLDDTENNPYLSDLVRRYQLDERVIDQAVRQLKPNHYLYADVADFLQRMQGDQVLILTTGLPRYQELKFQVSPALADCAHQIIADINKGEYLKQRLRYGKAGLQLAGLADEEWYQQLYLIDDRNYNLNALVAIQNVKLYHIRRPTEKIRDTDLASSVQVIKSLEEVA